MTEAPWCLVLGGGGARGIYHIGVWRALREIGVKVEAFIGTSIGAVVAAFLAQGREKEVEELGLTMTLDRIVRVPPEFMTDGDLRLDPALFLKSGDFLRSVFERGGLDTSPFRALIEANIDEAALRGSGIDLGVVTVNLSDLKPEEIFIEDMPEGSLVDFLLASSAFPGFENPRIEGKRFVDGGLHDNVPYAMARKRGYRRIIVSDISGPGISRHQDFEGAETVYIRNSIELGGPFDFDREFLDSFLLLGYLDTLKAFGRLSGYSYFIARDPEADRRFAAPASKALAAIRAGETRRPSQASITRREAVLPERMRHERNRGLAALECAASILGVERIRAYSPGELAGAAALRLAEVDEAIAKTLSEPGTGFHGLLATLRDAIERQRFDQCPYYYYRLVKTHVPRTAGSFLASTLERFFPDLELGLAFIEAGGLGARET